MSDNRTESRASSFPSVIGYEIHAEERRDRLGVVYCARQLLYRREVALRLIDERVLGGGRDLTALCRAAREASSHSAAITPRPCRQMAAPRRSFRDTNSARASRYLARACSMRPLDQSMSPSQARL